LDDGQALKTDFFHRQMFQNMLMLVYRTIAGKNRNGRMNAKWEAKWGEQRKNRRGQK
jgi:hypothetical protein